MHSISHEFDELMLPAFGEGAMFYGTAELIECGNWYRVADIKLGNTWLPRPPQDGGGTLEMRLFKAIADVLVKDEYAGKEWEKSIEELRYDRSERDVYSALAAE